MIKQYSHHFMVMKTTFNIKYPSRVLTNLLFLFFYSFFQCGTRAISLGLIVTTLQIHTRSPLGGPMLFLHSNDRGASPFSPENRKSKAFGAFKVFLPPCTVRENAWSRSEKGVYWSGMQQNSEQRFMGCFWFALFWSSQRRCYFLPQGPLCTLFYFFTCHFILDFFYIYILCSQSAQILTTLPGHKAVVNCTHWLPSSKFLFKGTFFLHLL